MTQRKVSWRDRFGDEITCLRCLEVKDSVEMDRLLWCRACRDAARSRATRRGWGVGIAAAAALSLWIWVAVDPTDLIPGGWLATIVAAAWIVARVAQEIFFGAERVYNRRAIEAVPPADLADPESGPAL
jgi:hypothetical protein